MLTQNINPELKKLLIQANFGPAILAWNRLEGRPRKEDFERSLRVEVRDPLWMLSRQWQFGEFKGEDAGSAINARVRLDSTRLNRFAVRKEGQKEDPLINSSWDLAVPYNDELPLETEVEREALIHADSTGTIFDLELRVLIGRRWVKLLKQAGLSAFKPAFVQEYAFRELTGDSLERAQLESDVQAWQRLLSLIGRLPDGIQLLQAIQASDFTSFVNSNPAFAGEETALIKLGNSLKDWFFRVYSQPGTNLEDAWAPAYLEYQFAVSAPEDAADDGRSLLVAEAYHHGHLDWYSFEVDRRNSLEDAPDQSFDTSGFKEEPPISFLPSAIEYNGMPNVRWWEFEDRRIDFGNLSSDTTDVPHMLLAEFGLVYGNDWSVLPYRLEVGSLCEIKGIVVTDVFGQHTFIRPAGSGNDQDLSAWSLYDLNIRSTRGALDKRLFLPPAIARLQESAPIEKVILARDEMANLVWGVEEIIPGISGRGENGFERALAIANYFLQHAPEEDLSLAENEAKIRYILGTSVPENWIPFIATKLAQSNRQTQLQRATMPRLTDNLGGTTVAPRGRLLRQGLDQPTPESYFIHEEEVPRAGIVVTRRYQRTRWTNGKVYTWLGRQKKTGRGQGASGLGFDLVVGK